MKFLLDTHTFIWMVEDPSRLGNSALSRVEDPSNELFLSLASLWEMAIKVSRQKLRFSQSFEKFLPYAISETEVDLLEIRLPHLLKVAS